MPVSSRRETRLWIAAAILVLFTYSTLYVARFATDWLRERGLLYATLVLVFAVVLGAALRGVVRLRPGRWEWAVLLAIGLVYGLLFRVLHRAEEAMHFIQYGILGGLIYAALVERRRGLGPGGSARRFPALSAIFLTLALGWLDEGIQYVLPNRYYDLRDVALNAAAGLLAILAMTGREWAREKDRGGDPPVPA